MRDWTGQLGSCVFLFLVLPTGIKNRTANHILLDKRHACTYVINRNGKHVTSEVCTNDAWEY